MAELPKVCESLHLPIQSGSDSVLQNMKRGYTSGEYLKNIDKVKEAIPEISLSSDVIVGFPGETDEDFEKTRDIIKSVRYDGIFLFKYSPRPETPASEFSNQIPNDVKQARFEDIMELQKEITLSKNKELEGNVVEILIEGNNKNDNSKLTGRTRTNKLVTIPTGGEFKKEDLTGKLIDVKITRANLYGLEGIKSSNEQ